MKFFYITKLCPQKNNFKGIDIFCNLSSNFNLTCENSICFNDFIMNEKKVYTVLDIDKIVAEMDLLAHRHAMS